ncbi:MAG: PEP-CTERM sorting domain-containing protein [Microcystis sp. M54BS1]|uniref:PEP-CTERM sorting domain-containing protein n=1 Tax=unclassified Microcystis TaxID=2643300 RepID=UPI00257D5BB9|nr:MULTISPECIES: PEP-CTERM sorting domain-containing protein [unclassified Microcystis]MCA2541400.1 PEP-CTERM sorting domain-containing protein [Microcystis sp. M54BS1]MCA2594813.1 PEP-CTERM sorting domain-containing protein [Microcystis sp. M38BS1]MCA2609637.1 PEP-CTERM sorting domain-containing protein [Microcystis sp. M27BS1]MCA2505685.1 PEP-CTERM sorting domain-containing protein [Microcystis sp. M62BS1]MCA2511796.1 PEP-CTERM sorting domain-containing protein [Microcystis sp. M60BS1]
MKITHKLLFSSCLLLGVTVGPSQVLAGPFNSPGPFVDPSGKEVPFPPQVPGKEYSEDPDRNGNPLHTPNPGQVIAWDGTGGTTNTSNFLTLWNPTSGFAAPAPFQVDALANRKDLLFYEVIEDLVPLVFSTGLPGGPRTNYDNYIFYERPNHKVLLPFPYKEIGVWATPAQINQVEPNNVEGLELWAPVQDPTVPLEDRVNDVLLQGPEIPVDDANRYSLLGDPLGCSVFKSNGDCLFLKADIATAITPLFPGLDITDAKIDLDGLMTWENDILFSLKPIDGNNDGIITDNDPSQDLDGGEIFVWLSTEPSAKFLIHGGHVWDTAFNVKNTVKHWTGLEPGTENIDALEAVAVPEPSTFLSLLTLGTLGAASTLKRKLKSSKTSEN